MATVIFLLLTLSPFLVTSSSLHGNNVGECTDNQVELTRDDEIHFVAIGDWGSGNHHQKELATTIGDFCLLHECDFIVSTGDNMYSHGVESPFDKLFDERWKDVYTHPSIAGLPWYMTVGNHDHHEDREWHQVEYSALEPRWKLPCLTHSFNVSTKGTSAMFVSIDTVSVHDNKNGALEMKELLDSELAKAGSDAWKIVFGHYPCHSGGHYGGSGTIREQLLPIMKPHNVDFYLTGHDHNLQHWTSRGNPSGIDHMIIGAGGQNEYAKSDHNVEKNEKLGMDLEYFNQHYGFSYFSISNTDITVKFINADGNTIYEYTRNKH